MKPLKQTATKYVNRVNPANTTLITYFTPCSFTLLNDTKQNY